MSAAPPRIAFVGPVADPGLPAKGGYESANRRTIDLLRAHQIQVLEYPYPDAHGNVAMKTLIYALGFTRIAGQMFLNRKKWNILHITPLRRQFIVPESMLCAGAQAGEKVFLDLRDGRHRRNYEQRGPEYRRKIDKMIAQADKIAVEGMEDQAHVAQRAASGKPFYFPNYVTSVPEPAKRPPVSSAAQLICVGRMVPEKGPEIAIQITKLLVKSGKPVSLTLVGTGQPEYMDTLKSLAEGLPVTFTGPLPPEQVAEQLAQAHFFVFPTTHGGEGHSNALTEAMAAGAIPVSTDNGFCQSVIGDTGIVLPMDAPAEEYVQNLLPLLADDARWQSLSDATRERVAKNYTAEVLIPLLLKEYRALVA